MAVKKEERLGGDEKGRGENRLSDVKREGQRCLVA